MMRARAAWETIEIQGFKWPQRPTARSSAWLLGEDRWGRWLGIARDTWWYHSSGAHGTFPEHFIKFMPHEPYWSACFRASDPIIDIDLIDVARWLPGRLEEVDLELDIVQLGQTVAIRDQAEFAALRQQGLPAALAAAVEATCAQVHARLLAADEPFGSVGAAWLAQFGALL